MWSGARHFLEFGNQAISSPQCPKSLFSSQLWMVSPHQADLMCLGLDSQRPLACPPPASLPLGTLNFSS